MTTPTNAATEIATEIVVIGGGLGGVSATLAAARLGRRVVLVEEPDWLGGQLTSQVPPDEHPWIELTASQPLPPWRRGIREYYRRHSSAHRGSSHEACASTQVKVT
jgi:NADPH-dependent 2,4-dienoyl-CoA reductase/sulfur reductase-like enzyme